MKKMNCTREKAEELASRFGISKDVVNSFRYIAKKRLGAWNGKEKDSK